ncbi:MAG: hypothetical protein NVS9B7_27700 [Flavisolibacter sp.]
MKKIAAILFVTITLFYLFGYQLLIGYLQNIQESSLEAKLDNNNYNETDLITIKLPVTLPYYYNSKIYARINGTIEINGIEFKYVKRRIYNDSIELACIPNFSKKQFQSVKDDFVKLSSEGQNNHQEKKSPSVKIACFEYCDKIISFSTLKEASTITALFSPPLSFLPSTYILVKQHPPDDLSCELI